MESAHMALMTGNTSLALELIACLEKTALGKERALSEQGAFEKLRIFALAHRHGNEEAMDAVATARSASAIVIRSIISKCSPPRLGWSDERRTLTPTTLEGVSKARRKQRSRVAGKTGRAGVPGVTDDGGARGAVAP